MGLSRLHFLRALGVVKPDLPSSGIVQRTAEIYDAQARLAHEGIVDDSPHGAPWHTSFHASSFPGNDGCARQQVYSLLNVPDTTPTPGWLIGISDAGKDIERQIVRRWADANILLTAHADEKYQTNFEHPGHWLTCSLDAALDLRPDVPWPHAVDIKGKDHHVIDDLQRGIREPDPGHVKQLMVQVWSIRQHRDMLGDFPPPQAGSILYVSRQRPLHQHEAWIDFDQEVINAGLATLKEAREHFLDEWLPKRPKEWRWTKPPCQWCSFKKDCKADIKADIVNTADSSAVKRASELNPAYSYATVRKAVLSRWQGGGST